MATKRKVKKVKKTIAKKKAIKKVAKKITKKAPKKTVTKIAASKKPYTKTEMLRIIGEHAGITKKQAGIVFEILTEIIHNHLKKGSAGIIKLEGLVKIERIHKPAKKARKGINPFTGEEMLFKAKPAHDVIKVRALKKLKEMVK